LLGEGSTKECVIIDPTQDPYLYDEAARAHHLRIVGVWETHTHADHISSARALASTAKVPIHLPAKAGATFPHVAITDGARLKVGDLEVRAIATPGHTPDAMSFVSGDDALVGDTLLVGTVGRADFYPEGPVELYHSIFDKMLKLSDGVRIYPCHFGPKHGLPAERTTTLGRERKENEALTQKSKDDFVKYMTEGWPPQPHGWKDIMWQNTHE
jgi:glyoxylase-like metal-dependent hydrolase (beta-lactamase superfamily II)